MRPRISVLALLVLLSACAHYPQEPATVARAELDPGLRQAYDLPGPAGAVLKEQRTRIGPTIERWDIELAPQVPADLETLPRVHDPIEILWLKPHPPVQGPCPVVLMFPILSNTNMLMCEFGGAFVNQGMLVGIVPRKDLGFDPSQSADRAEDELRALILRSRQALDWMCAQPEADPELVGIFGISAGGIMAACLAGIDARVKATVLVFPGGPMADVLMDTVEDSFVTKRHATMKAKGWSAAQLREKLRGVIRTDPLLLAPSVDPHSVLFLLARGDRSVPTQHQRALWDALGRPERIELIGGHYGAFAMFFPHMLQRSRAFLTARLLGATQAPGG